MPPVITNVNVCPVQLLTPVRDTEVGVTTSVDGVGTGVPGGAWVPGMLRSCAVVVLPAESWIVNVSGLTQVPLVVARKKLPLDPWGNPFVYLSPGVHSRDYDLISYGADGQPGGEKFDADINSWELD